MVGSGRQMSANVGWANVGKCGQMSALGGWCMWANVGKCGHVWGGFVRFREVCVSLGGGFGVKYSTPLTPGLLHLGRTATLSTR